MINPENLCLEIRSRISRHGEWLLIHASGKSFALQASEIEIEFVSGQTLFGFLDDRGFQSWRVAELQVKDEEIVFHLSRNFGRQREKIRLVPRASARALSESVELARLEKANQIAALIEENFPAVKIARVDLNRENGRFAQMIFQDGRGRQTAALSDVSENLTPEVLLSSAILWQTKLAARRRNPIETVWILGERKQARKLQKLHALLRENWRRKIFIKEISREGAKTGPARIVKDLRNLEIADLWRVKAKKINFPGNTRTSEIAEKIIALSPENIDAVFSRNGETLRFRGLPFARARNVFEREKVWFGLAGSNHILTDENWADLLELIEHLKNYRRFDSPTRRHALYQTAPEAWVEAAFRRNVKLIDANLILSPLHQQFRAGRERVDLLALRSDGRLAIIELKIATDREMIFQACDYWRKIESQRRAGNFQKARLFGEAKIADRPAVCYLVAPTLSFHRDFEFLAQTVSPEIEIHRFDLAENWRENLKILSRKSYR